MKDTTSCVALLVAACSALACIEPDHALDPGDVVRDDPTELSFDRVVNEAERQRMQQYVDDLYAADAVVHSFEAGSGEAIDCVDIFEQPGLRRPGMADHELQFAPRNRPAGMNDAAPPSPDLAARQAYIRAGEYDRHGAEQICPAGTIPILRLTMDTLSRFETLADFRRKPPLRTTEPEPPQLGSDAFHQYATASRAVANMGAESIVNVWNPHVKAANEFSLSQIWIVGGDDEDRETVEVGWQKYPNLYGDWDARLFIYFTPDDYGKDGCYNLNCKAFVQINNSVVIAGKYAAYSAKNGAQHVVRLFWYKDGTSGHWWLMVDNTWIGYYPRTLFDGKGLRNRATWIGFGGEILDTQGDGIHTHTDMGSGAFADSGWAKAAFQRNLRYVDLQNSWRAATGLTASSTNPWCYDILLDHGRAWKNYFYYGGAGYSDDCE